MVIIFSDSRPVARSVKRAGSLPPMSKYWDPAAASRHLHPHQVTHAHFYASQVKIGGVKHCRARDNSHFHAGPLLSISLSGDRHLRLHSRQRGRDELLQRSADQCFGQERPRLVERRAQRGHRSVPHQLRKDDHSGL